MNSPGSIQRGIANNNAKITSCIALFLTILAGTSCSRKDRAPDVSHLDGSFELIRTEQELFRRDTLLSADTVQNVIAQHPVFWELYFTQIVPPLGAPSDTTSPDLQEAWYDVVRDPYLREIFSKTSDEYAGMDDIRHQLETAFQNLQYYFPGNRVPRVYTLVSGFGFFPFIFEDGDRDGLGISLEMFLGADFPYRSYTGNSTAFSDYLIRSYNRDHVVKRTLDVMVDDLTGPPAGDRLIDQMIHNGIKLYIIEHLQPEMADTVLFEFTPAQLEWCAMNERNLWAHVLEDDLLYSNSFAKIQKLTNPAPAVGGMPAEAPGGVANWTGWKIIHAYMERNPTKKLVDLLTVSDAQAVVEESRYRPR